MQVVIETKQIIEQLGIEYKRFELFWNKEAKRAEQIRESNPQIVPSVQLPQSAMQTNLDKLTGRMVKDDIYSESGTLLIAERTILTRYHVQLLRLHRVTDVQVLEAERKSGAVTLLQEASRYAEDLFYRMRTNRKVPLLEIRSHLIPLIREAAEHDELFQIIDAVRSKDSYTYKHSVGVGVLATLLGKWMGLSKDDQSLIAMAATLHDVGKTKVSQELLQKPGKLTESEYEDMKRHTIFGYHMLKETSGLNPRIALAALQHHERADGSGYPLKLIGLQIDPISKLVAVADVFHAMTSDRPYQQALPFQTVLEQLRQCTFQGLDPHIVSVLIKNVGRNLLGKHVVLSDGRMGEVVFLNPHDAIRPLVQVKQQFLDLSVQRELHIQSIIA